MKTIVVGVDGSKGSGEALKWALGEATLRGAKLRLVCGWEVNPIVFAAGYSPGPVALDASRAGAEAAAEEALAEVQRLEPSVPVETKVAQGAAVDVILGEARDADLVVVGNRGHGELSSLVLGSVSHEVVHRAPCPVVVIRESQTLSA